MTLKGYTVLEEFTARFGSSSVAYVVSARDAQVEEDYHETIEQFCRASAISFHSRNTLPVLPTERVLRFAIGWRWLIEDADDLIVLHDSLLPKYRGFAPIVSAMLNGDEEVGVTALRADKAYDTGDIIAQQRMAVQYPVKINDVITKLAELYVQLVNRVFDEYTRRILLDAKPQDNSLATYSVWQDELDYFINWAADAKYIKRQIDALGFPYTGAKTRMNGNIVKIYDAEEVDDVVVEHRETAIGKVLRIDNGQAPVIICKHGLLKLTQIVSAESGQSVLPLKKFRTRFD